jgi:hypothetical protein
MLSAVSPGRAIPAETMEWTIEVEKREALVLWTRRGGRG